MLLIILHCDGEIMVNVIKKEYKRDLKLGLLPQNCHSKLILFIIHFVCTKFKELAESTRDQM